jgi:TetR/AcrR family transcriptional regulator, biofilm operon repressor
VIDLEIKNVRIPQQKRSIEKKERIIEAAYQVFSRKGYFSTNTAEIAKEAGLSTGSVYAYYTDKKDILLACLYKFGDNLMQGIGEKIDALAVSGDINDTVRSILQICINYQSNQKLFRDEVMSLQFRDDDVKQYFINTRKKMMTTITKQLEKSGYAFRNKNEQVFLLFQLVNGIEDELAFEHSPDINQDVLINECTATIISMLNQKPV